MFHQQVSLTVKQNQSVKEMVLFVSRVNIRFWHEEPLANRAPLNGLYYYLRSSENIQIWVNWQRLPWLHSVHLGNFGRPVIVWWHGWSGCEITDGDKPLPSTIHQFFEMPCLSSWTPQLCWPCLLLHREDYCHLWRSAIERKREGAKLPFEESWRMVGVMILPTRTSGWQHQPWQLCMTLLREPLLWCSSTVCHWQRMKSKSSSFVSWIRPHWWRWQRPVHNRYQWIQIKV